MTHKKKAQDIPYTTRDDRIVVDQKAANEFWDGEQKFKRGDSHPTINGLFYRRMQWREPFWETNQPRKERRAAKEELRRVLLENTSKPNGEDAKTQPPMKLKLDKLVLDQQAMQVSTNKKFKFGDEHPEYDVVFKEYHRYYGHQQWCTKEWLENKKAWNAKYKRTKRQEDPEWARAHNEKAYKKKIQKAGGLGKFNKKMAKYHRDRYNNNEKIRLKQRLRTAERSRGNIKLHKDAQDALHDVFKLRETLTLCARAAGSSEAFHVDHVWPLKPKKVKFSGKMIRPYVGLHAPWNMQILEASENIAKLNKTPTT